MLSSTKVSKIKPNANVPFIDHENMINYDSFGNTLKESSSEFDENSLYDCESDDDHSNVTAGILNMICEN